MGQDIKLRKLVPMTHVFTSWGEVKTAIDRTVQSHPGAFRELDTLLVAPSKGQPAVPNYSRLLLALYAIGATIPLKE